MDYLSDSEFQAGLEKSLAADYSAAVSLFESVASRFPEVPEVHYELGLAFQRRAEAALPSGLQQKESAYDSGAGIVSSVGNVVNAFLGLAIVSTSTAVGQTDWIVKYREEFRKSAACFERAIALDAAYAPAYYALSHSQRYLGQNELAAANAQKASELEPGNRHYHSRAETLDNVRTANAADSSAALTWDDVILPDRTKRELRQMQLLLENPKLSRDLGIDPPTGLLLYGPPGTGKTTIARVLAHEAKCRFFATTPAQVNSMWMGESEKQVARLFAQARASAPSIVFLDEIDALLPSRSGGINLYSDKVVNQFLHEMDGMNRNVRVFVVGATNRRDMLDPALLRGGRLSREIEIPLPDQTARRAMLTLYTKGTKLAADVDLDELAQQTAGYSGANIKALVNEAGLQALIRLSDGSEPTERSLSRADFTEALTNLKPSADEPPPGPFRMFG